MRSFAAVLIASLLAGCASMEKLPPPPTTAEIVEMAKKGETADAIILRMQQSRAVYPLPASELARLREQSVPDKVIDYMQQTYLEEVRYREWLRAGYPPYYPLRPYPYPYFGRHPWW